MIKIDKHKAIFKGVVERKVYKFDYDQNDVIYYSKGKEVFWKGERILKDEYEFIENKIITSTELDNPILKVEEEIYIAEIDKTVRVKRVARNSDGGYIYWTDYVSEVIQDEKTEKTYLQAKEEEIRYGIQKELDEKEMERRRKERDEKMEERINCLKTESPVTNKKWWEIWK